MISSIGSNSTSDAASLMRMMQGQRRKSAEEMSDELFKATDADGNGTIGRDELASAVKKRSTADGAGGPDADELFSKLDANGDGSISKEEHAAGLKAMHQKLEQQAGMTMMRMPPPPDGQGGMSPDDLFESTDADGDESITTSELTEALKKRASGAEGDGPDVDDLFATLDADGDGKVTREEHSAGLEKLKAQRGQNQGSGADSSGIGAAVLKALIAKYGAASGDALGVSSLLNTAA